MSNGRLCFSFEGISEVAIKEYRIVPLRPYGNEANRVLKLDSLYMVLKLVELSFIFVVALSVLGWNARAAITGISYAGCDWSIRPSRNSCYSGLALIVIKRNALLIAKASAT